MQMNHACGTSALREKQARLKKAPRMSAGILKVRADIGLAGPGWDWLAKLVPARPSLLRLAKACHGQR